MGCDPSECAFRAPNAAAKAFQLYDLAVINEEVDVDTVVLFAHQRFTGDLQQHALVSELVGCLFNRFRHSDLVALAD